MRILYFSRDYTPHDHRFLATLAGEKSFEVFFLRLERRNRQTEDRPVPSGVNIIAWRGGKRPLQLRDGIMLAIDLRRVIRYLRPDVIHAGPIQNCALLAALTGFRPLVSMSWGSDLLVDAQRNLFWKAATRFTLSRTTILLADCEAVRQKGIEFGVPIERTVIFPWGIDLNQFAPGQNEEFRSRRGWEDNIVLLSLRSWEPIYGVDLVVKAFCRASIENDRLRLILLGGGSMAPQIHALVAQHGLEERVYFGGQVAQKDLPSFYHASDFYLSASHSDGSSVSLMEALGCGLPVIVSDIPGNREWITQGKQGWLFQDGDEDALVRLILQAAEAMDALEMRKEARKLAEERADWRLNSQKLFESYHRAVQYAA